MNDNNPWAIPRTANGHQLVDKTYKWDVTYKQAVMEIAAEESEKWGRKIGFATLNMNLATRHSGYLTEVRGRLRERVKQITKENKSHAHHVKPTQEDSRI